MHADINNSGSHQIKEFIGDNWRSTMQHLIALSNLSKTDWENYLMRIPVEQREYIRLVILEINISDTDRLEWIMHKISGKAWRNIGVIYEDSCNRDAIDKAILAESLLDEKNGPSEEKRFA